MSNHPLQQVPSGVIAPTGSTVNMIEAVRAVYREGRRELEMRNEPDQVVTDRGRVSAMEEVLRRAVRDREERLYAQNLLAELRLHQERWLGRWLATNVNHTGGGDRRSRVRVAAPSRDLPDGISKNQSSAFQRLAAVPDDLFNRYLAESRGARMELTTAGALRFTSAQQPRRTVDRSAGSPASEYVSRAVRRLRAEHPPFGTLYVDPHWVHGRNRNTFSEPEREQVLSVEDLARLPVGQLAADDAHLHLLAPDEFLFDCPRLLCTWGFAYRGVFVWTSRDADPGDFWQVSHVCMVLGVRGRRPFNDQSVRSWAELQERPVANAGTVRALLQRVSPGPHLDLFGRGTDPSWVFAGDLMIEPGDGDR